MAIIAIAAAIAFPAVSSGIESLRLKSASDSIVSFLNAGLNRAERRQQLVEVAISRAENNIVMRSEDAGFARTLSMPEGVTIVKIHPDILGEEEKERRYVLYPGGTIPRVGVEVANRRGQRRIVRVDPITGVPQVEVVGDDR
jgi:hypothetical protein